MNAPDKNRGNFKKRQAIENHSKMMERLRSQKTISTHLVLEHIESLQRHNDDLKRKHQKLAVKTNNEIQMLRKQLRILEARNEHQHI